MPHSRAFSLSSTPSLPSIQEENSLDEKDIGTPCALPRRAPRLAPLSSQEILRPASVVIPRETFLLEPAIDGRLHVVQQLELPPPVRPPSTRVPSAIEMIPFQNRLILEPGVAEINLLLGRAMEMDSPPSSLWSAENEVDDDMENGHAISRLWNRFNWNVFRLLVNLAKLPRPILPFIAALMTGFLLSAPMLFLVGMVPVGAEEEARTDILLYGLAFAIGIPIFVFLLIWLATLRQESEDNELTESLLTENRASSWYGAA